MNRRDFLRALVATPVAAPVIAAQAHAGAFGGFVSGIPATFIGEMPSEQITMTLDVDTSAARVAIDELTTHARKIQHMTALGDPRDYTWSNDECRCPQCTEPQDLHPLQAITDAPSIVPDDTAMHRAAVEAGYAPLREYVSDRVFDGVRPITARDVFNRLSPRPVSRRTVVAFTGLAGSGKSTAAQHLVNAHGFARVRFAGPLKDMMRALGLTETEIEGDRKEVPCDLLGGRTPRYAMQTIGTEWGRDIIAPDLWIRAWNAAVAKLPPGKPVVCDDCRFPNEADAVRALGGVLVRIARPGAGTTSQHSSEGQDLGEAISISNVGSLADLAMDLDHLLTSQVKAGEVRGT